MLLDASGGADGIERVEFGSGRSFRGKAGKFPDGEAGRGRTFAARGFAGPPERADDDQRGRHGLPGGWNSGAGDPGDYVAGFVYDAAMRDQMLPRKPIEKALPKEPEKKEEK